MPLTTLVYDKAKEVLFTTDVEDAVLQIALIDAAGGYVPDKSHQFLTAIGAAELSTTNYERKTLTGVSTVTDAGLHRVGLTADPVVYTSLGPPGSSGPTIDGAVLYVSGGSDAASPLIAYVGGIAKQVNSYDVWVQFDSTGILRIT